MELGFWLNAIILMIVGTFCLFIGYFIGYTDAQAELCNNETEDE